VVEPCPLCVERRRVLAHGDGLRIGSRSSEPPSMEVALGAIGAIGGGAIGGSPPGGKGVR
jgi:disulfide bond formation protein DsbB